MLIQPMYYAIFYDNAYPKIERFAQNKRISRLQYLNLTDGMGSKTVELIDKEGKNFNYVITQTSTFHIVNSCDNTYFVICNCDKITNHEPATNRDVKSNSVL